MTNGTERDEPGQRSGDGADGSGPADDGTPSSDPVWPVWGGGAANGAGEATDEQTDEQTDEHTDEQGADAPTEPAAAERAVNEPIANEPVASEPVESEPIANEPAADEQPADEPVSDARAADEAAADERPADETVADEHLAAEPVAEARPAEERADEAAADEHLADESDADERIAAEPVADEHIGAEPVAETRPADERIAEPVADEPPAERAAAVPVGAVPAADEPKIADAPGADAGSRVAEPDVVGTSDGDDKVARADVADAAVPERLVAGAQGSDRVDADPTRVDAVTADEVGVNDAPDLVDAVTADEVGVNDAPDRASAGSAAPTDPAPEPAAPSPTAEIAAPSPAEPPARQPDRRDDATAVIAPVAAAAAAPAPTAPAPVGTLAAPVTRTVPRSAPATVAASSSPSPSGPVPPRVPTAAAAAGIAAATTGAATTGTATTGAAATGAAATGAAATGAATTAPAAATAPAGTAATSAAGAATTVMPPVPPGPASAAPTARTGTAPAAAAVPAAAAAAAGPAAPAAAEAPPRSQRQSPIPSGPIPPTDRSESPLDVFEPEDGKRRWPKRLLIVVAIVLALAAVYVGASYALADRVPRGATVAGVDVGGMTSTEAVAALDEELADATTQPIDVVANDVQATLDPVAAGLTFDSEATVDELTGVDLAEPGRLWAHLVGVGAHDPVTSVDDEALAAAIGDLGTSLALAPVDGSVVFVDSAAQSTPAVDGWDLDQAGAADVLASDWLEAARPIELPTATVAPDITQEETEAALTQARQVTSAPVTVAVADRTALLDTPTLAANASYVPGDGSLALQMNGEGLAAVVLAQLPDLLTQSADAHFEFVNDAPVIIPGTPGTSLDPAALAASVTTAATSDDRTAPVELVQADPAESTAELEALGVKEIVSEFSTPLNSEPRRTVNITNGASKISGTLIRPGETFSLTEALGPIDAAHGYVEAGAIVSGEHTDAWGGGLSQVSTTTYNAAFLAGFEDVEHRPHSEWFSRYPEGREATIFTGTLDMRWKNNTPYGALVQAWVSGGRVYVRVWGTAYWTVESITSPRSGVVAPTTVYSQSPTCEAQAAGNPGFSVTVTRKTYLNGALEKTESNSWRYKPQNKVICGAPPTATPPAAP